MRDLIVIGYPDKHTAEQVLTQLAGLQHDYLLDLEPTEPSTDRRRDAASASSSCRIGGPVRAPHKPPGDPLASAPLP
jgi:hypothetical protein